MNAKDRVTTGTTEIGRTTAVARVRRAVGHARERLALEPNREGWDIPGGERTRDWVAVRRTSLEALVAAAVRPGDDGGGTSG